MIKSNFDMNAPIFQPNGVPINPMAIPINGFDRMELITPAKKKNKKKKKNKNKKQEEDKDESDLEASTASGHEK